jgi:uncharacterized protein (UPF0548 family)
MWSLRKPTDAELIDFLSTERDLDFSYANVGATATTFWPQGFDHDRNRVSLGNGDAIFRKAALAVSAWRHFPAPWTRIVPANSPISKDTSVALLIRAIGVWWWSSARIVYTIDEAGPTPRFGFAYGTLPSHVEKGEEQFLLEMDVQGDVWYSINSFSRPRILAARLAYPIVRRLQRRFVRDSFQQMSKLVQTV